MASRRSTDSPRAPTSAPTPTPTPPDVESSSPPEKAATPRKPRAKKVAAPKVQATIEISADLRRGMIAEAAYLRAERRGFTGGAEKEKEDWILAEAEVDALLEAGHGSSAQ
jgi:hypothetical protein